MITNSEMMIRIQSTPFSFIERKLLLALIADIQVFLRLKNASMNPAGQVD